MKFKPCLRCYICGHSMEQFLTLVTTKLDADWVFIVHSDCESRIRAEDKIVAIKVERVT